MIILLMVLYKMSLDFVYSTLFIFLYGYLGYNCKFEIIEFLISWIIYGIYILIFKKNLKIESCSSIIISLLTIFYFVPILTLYAFSAIDSRFFIYSNIYFFMLVLIQNITPLLYIENNNNQNYERNLKIYNGLIIICCLFSLYLNVKYTGFRIVLDFLNVYEIREEASKYALSSYEKYAFNLLPILLAGLSSFCLQYKNRLGLILIIFAELLLFSIAGQKVIFFLTLLNIVGYYIYGKYKYFVIFFLLIVIPFIGYLEYILTGITWIIGIVYDRIIFGTPYISFQYYNFFQNNPINFFRDGIVGKFGVESIYSIELGKIIAESMQKSQFNNANNGLLGNALSGVGEIGLFILPIVIIVSLRCLDYVTYKKPQKLFFGTCFYFYLYYANGSFSEVLVGGGLLLLILLYYFFPLKKERE